MMGMPSSAAPQLHRGERLPWEPYRVFAIDRQVGVEVVAADEHVDRMPGKTEAKPVTSATRAALIDKARISVAIVDAEYSRSHFLPSVPVSAVAVVSVSIRIEYRGRKLRGGIENDE